MHVYAVRKVDSDFHRAFKLSRGVAAILLTGVGVWALAVSFNQTGSDGGPGGWHAGFLFHHATNDVLRFGMYFVLGHFTSDFLWMLWGRHSYGYEMRADLVIHHGIGLLTYGIALYLNVAYAICLITMVSELMPVTTGLSAWEQHEHNPRLVGFARKARLLVLVWWRGPLWGFLGAALIRAIWMGDVPNGLLPIFILALVCMIALLGLDEFWIRKCMPRGEPKS